MEPRRSRRRVPEELRKRTELSCDLCRKRRCKCVRRKADESCRTCQQNNVECVSTFRRKTRLYGSLETVRDRYRCLEAIVNSAFPDEPTRTVEDLLSLGQRHGFAMPQTGDVASSEDCLLTPGADRGVSQERSLSDEDQDGNSSTGAGTIHQDFQPQPWHDRRISQIQESPRLVRDSVGRRHYIGPSGTLAFFGELRDLVSTRQPLSRFAADNVAEALEARTNRQNSPRASIDGRSNSHGSPAGFNPTTSSPLQNLLQSAWRFRELPPAILENLQRLYFERVHSTFPLFDRPTFQDELERFFASQLENSSSQVLHQSAESTEHDEGWLVCLHMMLAFGCVLSMKLRKAAVPDNDHFDYENLRVHCWVLAQTAISCLSTTCTHSNVQALLLLALYYHSINERNASWTLVGCAARMAIAIGMHRNDINNSFRPIERETRKRIWCSLYSFEQFLCMSLGRPSAIDEQEVNTSLPSDDMIGSGYNPPGYTECSFQLQVLSSRLRWMMSVQYQSTNWRNGSSWAKASNPPPGEFLDELQAWEDGLPAYLRLPKFKTSAEAAVPSQSQLREFCSRYPSNHLRGMVLLHIQYHNLIIQLSRPYLLTLISSNSRDPATVPYLWEDVSSNAKSPVDKIAFLARTCVSSASRIADLILLLNSAETLDGLTGLDVFYAYSAAMVLILRILWVPDPSSPKDVLEAEKKSKTYIGSLVTELQNVLKLLPKCSTMQRFASVAENFADVVQSSNTGTRTSRTDNEGNAPSRSRTVRDAAREKDMATRKYSPNEGGIGMTPHSMSGKGMSAGEGRYYDTLPPSSIEGPGHDRPARSALDTLAEASNAMDAIMTLPSYPASPPRGISGDTMDTSREAAYEGSGRGLGSPSSKEDRICVDENGRQSSQTSHAIRTTQHARDHGNSNIFTRPPSSFSDGLAACHDASLVYNDLSNPYHQEIINADPSFTEEGVSPQLLLWQDSLQQLTMGWNDFERFMGV
ncbi:transcriptional regulator family: Fungal Specific TF [Paecilomyces variotii]|nr:transcriptional regulator family: Fungal Specific TF [Paecilomyces variotii]KAJ9194659.1 transcriptional regulator family: Fungal Specific TF [Paecilomyces variotii]KAJ9220841.1 transcriptional regulator family: Fungal Specific TF [Paecilomyces variotii]KAJ9231295.1 transcriptional regulator family: Fungal Specific TF [Paecilomyces variotii]KAJ9246743.1 transcriptional regulator family: Fungal Specific TF [Paecilomyces variotii]